MHDELPKDVSRQQDDHKRQSKGFTLRPDVIDYVEEMSEKHGISQSQVAEDILLNTIEEDSDFAEIRCERLRRERDKIQEEIERIEG